MAKFNELEKVAKEHNIGGGNSDFLRIKEEGLYRLRIVSEYEVMQSFGYRGGTRWVKNLGEDSGVFYPGVTDDDDSVDVSTSNQFMMHVIQRGGEDGEDQIKLFLANWTIVKGIRDLAKDPEYAFDEETGLPPYDIKVRKSIDGPASNPSSHNYGVNASRENTPLTEDEKADIEELRPISEVKEQMKESELEKIKAGEYADLGVKFIGNDNMESLEETAEAFGADS